MANSFYQSQLISGKGSSPDCGSQWGDGLRDSGVALLGLFRRDVY